jgi:hypothetical protein
MLAPSLLLISRGSSLLRANPSLSSRTILVRLRLHHLADLQSNDKFSCSVQKPVFSSCQLCPGCPVTGNQVVCYSLSHRKTLPLAFDIVLSAIETYIAGSPYSTPIHSLAKVYLSLFLIVHYSASFRALQHKVVCKLPPDCRLRKALSFSLFVISWPVCSLNLHTLNLLPKSLPSFVQHSTHLRGLIQDTHVWWYGQGLQAITVTRKAEAGYNPLHITETLIGCSVLPAVFFYLSVFILFFLLVILYQSFYPLQVRPPTYLNNVLVLLKDCQYLLSDNHK